MSAHIPDVGGPGLARATLENLRTFDLGRLPLVDGSPRLGPCIANVGKIIGVGLRLCRPRRGSGMPIRTEPLLFMKATSAIIGPNNDVEIPRGSEKADWEVDLGVVIGKPAKYITLERAMEHVAGYCIVNDVSECAYQLERGGQWDKGKGCDTFAAVGPWLVTADEIKDPQNLDLWLDVDGRRYQTGNTRTMIFGVAHLVSYLSQFFSLKSGDIIITGAAPGVGLGQKRNPIYLRPGQTMRLRIEHLGVHQQRVVAASI